MEGPPKASKSPNKARTIAEAPGKLKKCTLANTRLTAKNVVYSLVFTIISACTKILLDINAKNSDETRNSRQKRVRSFNQNLDVFLLQAAAEKSSSSSNEDTIEDHGNTNKSDEEEMAVNSNKDEQEDDEDEACMFCGKLEPENYEVDKIDWIFCMKCKQ